MQNCVHLVLDMSYPWSLCVFWTHSKHLLLDANVLSEILPSSHAKNTFSDRPSLSRIFSPTKVPLRNLQPLALASCPSPNGRTSRTSSGMRQTEAMSDDSACASELPEVSTRPPLKKTGKNSAATTARWEQQAMRQPRC